MATPPRMLGHLTQPDEIVDEAASSTAQTIPSYPCLDCAKKFKRRGEWIRHGSDVHQPELRRVCPYPNCRQQYAVGRLYRMKAHYVKDHNSQQGDPVDGHPISPSLTKIWACGLCVSCFGTWKELGAHILVHFKAGSQKHHWSPSVYIHSLLQQASVREYWQHLIATLGIEDEDIYGCKWIGDDVKKLRDRLEWDKPDRLHGSILAEMAFNTMVWLQASAVISAPLNHLDAPYFADQEQVHSGHGQSPFGERWLQHDPGNSVDIFDSEYSSAFTMMTGPSTSPSQPNSMILGAFLPAFEDMNSAKMIADEEQGSTGESDLVATPGTPFLADLSPVQTRETLDRDLDFQRLLTYDFRRELGKK